MKGMDMKAKVLVIIGLLLLIAVPSFAQTTQVTRIQWEIDGPAGPAGGPRPPFDIATAQGYTYKTYKVGEAVSVTLTSVTCTTTADAFVKSCSATLPTALDIPGINLDMTVTASDGIESVHSAATVVPPLIQPPSPPRNLRLQRAVVVGGTK